MDESVAYYVGSWRRSKFDPSIMPQSLNVDEKTMSVRLSNFDSEFNNLWKFNYVSSESFFLELVNPSPIVQHKFPSNKILFISNSLSLTDNKAAGLVLSLSAYQPFRQGPLDISMQLFSQDGFALVSNEQTGRVLLADVSEAEQRVDKEGNFVMNIAWEATPDLDEAVQGSIDDVPDWLHELLIS